MEQKYSDLINKAISASENSYSPYSGFRVGAALLARNGKIYTGCNIENASFSPTVCAERVAIFKAVSDGKRDFSAILAQKKPTANVGELTRLFKMEDTANIGIISESTKPTEKISKTHGKYKCFTFRNKKGLQP